MKINRWITAIVASAALLTTSCSDCDETTGLDKSLAAPTDIAYDSAGSSSTSIAITWNAQAANDTGATSFVAQIVTSPTAEGDNYNSSTTKILASTELAAYSATFTGLKAGAEYCVRVRANYTNSRFSEWQYLQYNGKVGAIIVGTGLTAPTVE